MARRVVFTAYGGPEVLHLVNDDPPRPGPGDIRVRVRAAGVNPVDCKIRRGYFASPGDTFPQTLGNEFAGVVDAIGPAVTGYTVGDEVLGFTTAAAYADYVVVPADLVTTKPLALPWTVAGALSVVGQTAYHALRTLRVGTGETLLVHGAAGGVGTMAVQLARHLGARSSAPPAAPTTTTYADRRDPGRLRRRADRPTPSRRPRRCGRRARPCRR